MACKKVIFNVNIYSINIMYYFLSKTETFHSKSEALPVSIEKYIKYYAATFDFL